MVSIITAVFNGEKHLEETINSVIQQTYQNVEYIIIDGGSTDVTIDILKKYDDKIDYWVSESDRGISDAFNKGIKAAHGDFINFQGDGDGFYDNTSLSRIFNCDYDNEMVICGRIQRITSGGNEIYLSKFNHVFNKKSLLFRMSLPHQALFTSKTMFEKHGLFDVDNVFCMDYEHLLRAYREFPNVIMKDVIVAKWRDDGLGNNRQIQVLKEYDKIKRKNKIASNTVLTLVNFWILFKYILKGIIKK